MEELIEGKSVERFNRRQDKITARMGDGDNAGAIGVAQHCLNPLTKAIEEEMALVSKLHPSFKKRDLLRVLRALPAEVLALTALQTLLHQIALGADYRQTCLALGGAVHAECWAAGLLRHNAKLATKIMEAASRSQSGLKERRQAARSMAKKAGYSMARWPKEDVLYAGNWLLCGALKACPNIFFVADDHAPSITEDGLRISEAAVEYAISRNAMWLPMQEPPEPWTGLNSGGYRDARQRFKVPVVRARSKETEASFRAAIASGQMQPALDALNTLQDVAWSINEPVLHVMHECYERCLEVPGLPRKRDITLPSVPEDFDSFTADQKKAWKLKVTSIRKRNRGFLGERLLLTEDLATARHLAGAPFWTPMNVDWRGRVYPFPHFNFQRDDRVRALFLFDRGEAIGAEGLKWLKVHVANSGDFSKISKRPMAERIAWVDEHLEAILEMLEHPLGNAHQWWWRDADKPFLFLAACMELRDALAIGSSFVTRLPCSFDGSCSGLQHLCAMTRAEEGSLVNLTPSALPQDVYETVAQRVRTRVSSDAEEGNELAALILTHGITRKLVKRNVMTYSYSSKKYGMSQQHMEDTMRPLKMQVLEGALDAHPFASDEDGHSEGSGAAKYLAEQVYTAIEEVVHKPALAMAFLQKIAQALAHEGKPVEWTTPTGLPWSNRYHDTTTTRVKLFLHDAAVFVNLITDDKRAINKDKAKNSVAPNFVHALDAAHLMLTVNASVREHCTQVATVHDSFGCLAPRATRFNAIIREQFVQMYETHDVLAEVLERSNAAMTVHNTQRLPEPVSYGSLNLKGVLNAEYAFA
jgi:DNA-directed RNA polymerase